MDRLVWIFVTLPLFKGSLIRRDKRIPAFDKLWEQFWDLVSSHGRRRIAESCPSFQRVPAPIHRRAIPLSAGLGEDGGVLLDRYSLLATH